MSESGGRTDVRGHGAGVAHGRKAAVVATDEMSRPAADAPTTLSPAKLALLEARRRNLATAPNPVIPVADRSGPVELSFAQERMWMLDQLIPGRSTYNAPRALRLRGPLDVEAMHRALDEIVRRHEVLRTVIPASEGVPQPVVVDDARAGFRFVDLSDRTGEDQESEALRQVEEELRTPFELSSEALLRARLIRLGDEDHVLALVSHHIASDDRSKRIVAAELEAHYDAFRRGGAPTLAPLPLQYRDYATWERQRIRQGDATEDADYWKAQLDGAPSTVELPTDHPRPPVDSYEGATFTSYLSAPTTERLRAVVRDHRATLFMGLNAGFAAFLSRVTGQDDIVVGTAVSGRSHTELDDLIGYFSNTLALRCQVDPEAGFADLLDRVRTTTVDAFAHQAMPFEKLVESIRPDRGARQHPIFQVMFTLRPGGVSVPTLGDLEVHPYRFRSDGTKYDLVVIAIDMGDTIQLNWEYSTDLFEGHTVERMAGQMALVIDQAVADVERPVGQLDLLDDAERHRVLVEFNDNAAPVPTANSVHELVTRRASVVPDAVAVTYENERLTYVELERSANRLAHRLMAAGVGRGVIVGICLDRSPEMITTILAVLKTGGAYVPLDPSYPAERLHFMTTDAGVEVLVTMGDLAGQLPELMGEDGTVVRLDVEAPSLAEYPDHDPGVVVAPEDLAYVIYTSGSTGRPKGAMIEHRSVMNLAPAVARLFGMEVGHRVLQFASLCFDVSVFEIHIPLMYGATVCMAPRDQLASGPDLLRIMHDRRINSVLLPPSLLAVLPDADLPQLTNMCSAGEACHPDLVRRWGRGRRYINAYGPTEATVFSAMHLIEGDLPDDATSVPIGHPVANTQAYILDEHMRPVPIGRPGELFIGGPCVGRGYLGRPELTAERFVVDPFSGQPGARLYRTGDRVRWLPDGTLDYIGRLDNQVKLRGYRIELGEIEVNLIGHPDVRDAAVIVREDVPGNPRLVAYVVPRIDMAEADHPDLVRSLTADLAARLPAHMVPGSIVVLQAFPMSPSGKVDRKALPEPVRLPSTGGGNRGGRQPSTPAQAQVAAMFREILGVDEVGADDDFFDLGGTSLLATKLLVRLESVFGTRPPLNVLFETATVAALAASVGGEADAPPPAATQHSGSAVIVPLQHGTGPTLFLVHQNTGQVLVYRDLVKCLPSDFSVFGVQAVGLDRVSEPLRDLPEMARLYVEEIRRIQPAGPYFLGGHCLGAVIALEMTHQLEQAGEEVGLLMASDTLPRAALRPAKPSIERYRSHQRYLLVLRPGTRRSAVLLRPLQMTLLEAWKYTVARLFDQAWFRRTASGTRPVGKAVVGAREDLLRRVSGVMIARGMTVPPIIDNVERSVRDAVRHYPLSPAVHCPVLLFRADRSEASTALATRRWSDHTTGDVTAVVVRGDNAAHYTMIRDPLVDQIAGPLAAMVTGFGSDTTEPAPDGRATTDGSHRP